MFKALLFFVFTLLLSINIHSQSIGVPRMSNFSKEDYHGGALTLEIDQFDNGILVAANNDGLLVFDGVEWSCFKQPNQTILRSIEVVGDRVYAGGQNELGYFDFSSYPPNYVSLLSTDTHKNLGEIWDTEAAGDTVFFRADDQLFVYEGSVLKRAAIDGEILKLMAVEGHVLVQNQDAIFNVSREKVAQVPMIEEDLVFFEKLPSEDVFIYEKSGVISSADQSQLGSKQLNDYLKENGLNVVERIQGGYGFGTKRGGLVITDESFSNFTIYDVANGLQRNDVASIFQIDNGDIWVGTNDGIDYLEYGASFRSLKPDGYLKGAGYAALEFGGDLFFGTGNGLFKLEQNDEGLNDYVEIENSKGQVWGLRECQGLMWVCHHEGLFWLDGYALEEVPNTEGVWEVMEVPGFDNQLIVGHYNGLSLIEKVNGTWRKTKELEGLKESSRIIAYEGDLVWWVSHPYVGAWRLEYDPAKKEISQIKKYGQKEGFPSDLHIYVKAIEGEMIFTAETGLYQFNREEMSIEPMMGFDEHFSEGIRFSRLFNGLNDQLWFVTENEFGVLKIEESALDKSIQKMIIGELKPKLVGGFEFLLPMRDGKAIAGVDDGFVMMDLDRFVEEMDENKGVQIRSVENLRSKEVMHSLFHAAQNDKETFEFDQSSRSLRIEYGRTSLRSNSNLRVETLLDGFEKEWVKDQGDYFRDFTNLKSGNYVFRARISNAQGKVLDEEVLRFEVMRPWYLSIWAWMVYAVFLLIVVLTLYKISSIQNEKEKEALVLQKEMELEDQKAKSGQVINELRNRRLKDEIVHKNKELASATMHLVQKAKVLQGIRDVLKQLDVADEDVTKKEIRNIIKTINNDIKLDKTWQQFERHFDQVHVDFLKRLRDQFPKLTPNDQKLCAYLRMNLTTKEIATIMNISVRGVEISRYRLRKKLELDTEVNLTEYILNL